MKNLLTVKKHANKGITLIALIITIIVLLILAGVAIATLTGENGILTQAKNAKKEMTKAEAKERIQLEVLGSYGTDGEIDIATLKTNIGKNIPEAVIGEETELPLTVTIGDYTFTVKDNGTVEETTAGGDEVVVGKIVTGDNKPYTKNGTAVIPVGFAIVPGLDDVSEGLVISDKENDINDEGNQFVWVPVSKENFATEFVRHDYSSVNSSDDKFVSGALSSDKYTEYAGDGINVDLTASETEQEAQKMYKSVKENGGFYIGRYEAGVEGVEYIAPTESTSSSSSQSGSQSGTGSGIRGTVVSKKGAYVYNYIGWNNDAANNSMTDETGGAVEVARGFAGEHDYDSVTSTLVYGVQWDAVMRWINKDDTLKGYLTNSSSVGNYSDSDSTNNPAKTGAVKEYQLKNIYDMAGNVSEWTMESYNTNLRVNRGGYYYDDGARYPVSDRNSSYGHPSYSIDGLGFRVALYL